MKAKHTLFLFLSVLLWLFISCSKVNKEDPAATKSNSDTLVVPHSMKGYELYSWPEGNQWYFALLLGTNRIKTYEEVISNTPSEIHLITVTGVDALKLALDRFPENEYITWVGKNWLQNTWSSNYGNFQLPPQNYMDDLVQYCKQRKLNLQIIG